MHSIQHKHIFCAGIVLLAIILITTFKHVYESFEDKVVNNRILILYSGGTIGMVPSEKGLIPKEGFLGKKLLEIIRDNEREIGHFEIKEYSPLLDSSDIYPKDWVKIAVDVAENYNQYDAFIIIHGTDTMSYSASALSFMFENLGKPVIITGSAIPLSTFRNDGANNLINSLIVASQQRIPEVILIFDNRIIRGNRSTKVNANAVGAFASPNFPLLGENGVDVTINRSLIKLPRGEFRFTPFHPKLRVVLIKLFPGIDAKFMYNILSDHDIQGVVLQTFGIGDAPSNKDFLGTIKEASRRGVVFVNCTQCFMGRVDEGDYATGSGLRDAGVVSGYDMMAEAAIAKLYFLLTVFPQESDREHVRKLVERDLRGEMTVEPAMYQQTGMFL